MTNHKRIYMVTPFENGLAKRGTRFIDIAEMLDLSGWEVVYITSNFSHAYKYFFSEKEINEEKDKRNYSINFIPIPGYRSNISIRRVYSNFIMSIAFYKTLNNCLMDGDYVMIPSRPVDFIFFVSLLKRNWNIKLILDIRDVWPDAFAKKNILFDFYCNIFLKSSIKKFDLYFHISPSFVKWLHRFNNHAKSLFVPPGFNENRFRNIRPIEKNDNQLHLVFIGALQYQLDLLPVIKAIGNDNRFDLTIFGEDGKGQRYKECVNYINEEDLNNVFFNGVLEPDSVAENLVRFDIGIIPMISNSITNKLFDYIAAYLPIIVLGDNDTSKFVLNYNIGWCTDFDVNNISKLLNDISINEINEKKSFVSKIRNKYSRDYLYKIINNSISQIQ